MTINHTLYFLIIICTFAITTDAEIWREEERPLFQNTVERPRNAGPPPGYIYLSHHGYYKLHPQRVPWLLAQFVCQLEGGNLVVLNSPGEANAIVNYWNLPNAWAWIGIHDLFDEGVYVTIYNQTLQEAGFNIVQPGELNGGVNENCGGMTKQAKLINHWCHEKLPFICEINSHR